MAKVLWTQKQDVGPSARAGHAVAYDTARQRVVLFGGRAEGGTAQGDTWEWDGADWTQVADTGPDARSEHALAFDANRQRAVLFGGQAAGPALRSDTWEWDGADWTQVADTGPGPSLAVAMTFGAGATLLFGGVATSPPPVAAEELSRLSWEWTAPTGRCAKTWGRRLAGAMRSPSTQREAGRFSSAASPRCPPTPAWRTASWRTPGKRRSRRHRSRAPVPPSPWCRSRSTPTQSLVEGSLKQGAERSRSTSASMGRPLRGRPG